MILYSKKICPWCFEKFNAADVNFRCDKCRTTDDPELHRFWGEMRPVGPTVDPTKMRDSNPVLNFNNGVKMFGTRVVAWEKAVCPQCHQKAHQMICPSCHNRVPNNMVKKKSFIISIVGARSSGKTIYITTLIDELKRRGVYLDKMGISAVNIADDPSRYTTARYDAMYKSLYEKKQTPAQTAINDKQSKVPLIYELSGSKKSVFLVFYDTAGENFNDINRITDNVKFLKASDAVIFLLDTFQVPYVHNVLGLRDNPGDLRYDAIFDNILSFFKEGDPSERKSYFKKPMAFVFSKIDAILNNEAKFESTSIANMSMRKNSYFLSGDGVLLSEFDSISSSIMGALNAWGETNFVNNITNNYKNPKFFGISSLGEAPVGINVSKVSPYRVLDPLVWILNELKYPLPIKEVGGK